MDHDPWTYKDYGSFGGGGDWKEPGEWLKTGVVMIGIGGITVLIVNGHAGGHFFFLMGMVSLVIAGLLYVWRRRGK